MVAQDHSRELEYDPVALLFRCDPASCDELLDQQFTGLDIYYSEIDCNRALSKNIRFGHPDIFIDLLFDCFLSAGLFVSFYDSLIFSCKLFLRCLRQ